MGFSTQVQLDFKDDHDHRGFYLINNLLYINL